MSKTEEDVRDDDRDTFGPSPEVPTEIPTGLDRRKFIFRSAVIGAAAVMNGCARSETRKNRSSAGRSSRRNHIGKNAATSPLSRSIADLNVVKKAKGPVMTTVDEFYKVGPGPSSSHTIGPMRITYDFYQRCTKLPADQLAKATELKVQPVRQPQRHRQGPRHRARRARRGHRQGTGDRRPAVPRRPARQAGPDLPGEARRQDDQRVASRTSSTTPPKGDFPHPNTMTCKLMAGDDVLLEQEYYSVGGGFIEWKGYTPPKKGQPKYPYSTMKELRTHADANKLSIAQIVMANEMAVSGKSEAEINAFIDKITTRWSRSSSPGWRCRKTTLPGPIKLQAKAATSTSARMDDKYEIGQRASASCRRMRWRLGRERARPPRRHGADRRFGGRHAGAGLRARWRRPQAADGRRSARACSPPPAVGYLCKHNATLSAPKAAARRRSASRRRWARRSSRRRTTSAAGGRERGRVVAGASPRHDVRSGRRLRAGAVHRALRVRRGQGVDRIHDREQRDPGQSPRRLRRRPSRPWR